MLDPESVADELLRRARLDTGEPVSLRAVAAALGITLVVARMRGTHDATLSSVIVFDGNSRSLAHALAHVACVYAGIPTPHDERFVAAVGARLVTPAVAFRRAVKWGAERAQLASVFGVSQTCAVLRRGELTHEPVAIVTPSTVYARGEFDWPPEQIVRGWVRHRVKWIRQAKLADDRRRVLVVPR